VTDRPDAPVPEPRDSRIVGATGTVTVTRYGRVARVAFERIDNRVNALSAALIRDLIEVARLFEHDTETAAVVLSGKPTIFSAGFDLKDAETRQLAEGPAAERRAVAQLGPRLVNAWAHMDPVTVAAIEGPCFGGGLALAAVCDFRIGGAGARFAAPEVERGLNMGWGSVPRLIGLLGVPATRRIVLKGESFSASQAEAAGLLDEVVADGTAANAALRWAQTIASRPLAQLKMAKLAINAAAFQAGTAAVALDADQFMAAAATDEFRAALDAFKG
jgi:enoyl-CoA hydratase/carnithine racemase